MSELLQHLTEKSVSDYDRLKDDAVLIDLDRWSLLELSGDDRKGWLQGQVTNDLRRFEGGASSSFCICSSTGQIEAVVDGWSLPDQYAFTCDRSEASAVKRRVDQMVILENVSLEEASQKYRLLSIQGPAATTYLAEFCALPKLDAGVVTILNVDVRLFRSRRTAYGGWDLWVPRRNKKILDSLRSTLTTIEEEAFEAARLEAGAPRAGMDYGERTLAPELGPHFENKYISYTKGCYTGQEVLMRIHSRGHTNKSWVGLLTDAPVKPGDSVSHKLKADCGTITSTAFSPDNGPIAGAMLRNEFAESGEEVVVNSHGGPVCAEVRRMPILRLS